MKKLIYLSLVASLGLTSCADYLDEPNDSFTNNPLSSSISPAQKIAGAQHRFLRNETFTYNRFGNNMTYAYALNGGFTSGQPEYTFNFSASSYDVGTWDNAYYFMDNLQDIIDTEASFPDDANYFAISKILKVHGMEKIIKLYGDAPFREAFIPTISTPKFDDDKQIVGDLLLLLDEARNQIVDAANDGLPVPGAEDIVFQGDMLKWFQFANTIELRILLSMSETTDANLIALRTARFANLSQTDFITEDVTFNPGFNPSNTAQINPMFAQYGVDAAQTGWQQANRSNAAGIFIAEVLNGTLNTPDLNSAGVIDPRRGRMFNLVSGNVFGATQGVEDPAIKSRLASFVHGYTGSSGQDAYNNGTSRDAYTMLYSECLFMQAEADQRGYFQTNGNAQALFTQGIIESFNFYSKPFGSVAPAALNPAAYLAAIDSKEGLGWTGSSDKINAIITQKWLALSQWTGIEPYFDMTRTGYPKSPLPVGVAQTRRPVRLIYSSAEYSSNTANTPNVVLSDMFTINATTPYYVKP